MTTPIEKEQLTKIIQVCRDLDILMMSVHETWRKDNAPEEVLGELVKNRETLNVMAEAIANIYTALDMKEEDPDSLNMDFVWEEFPDTSNSLVHMLANAKQFMENVITAKGKEDDLYGEFLKILDDCMSYPVRTETVH